MPFYEILETIAEIFIQEQDNALVTQINRLESEVNAKQKELLPLQKLKADIDVKINAKQKEITDKQKQITGLRQQLQRKPLPPPQSKGAPESTAPSPAATPRPSAL